MSDKPEKALPVLEELRAIRMILERDVTLNSNEEAAPEPVKKACKCPAQRALAYLIVHAQVIDGWWRYPMTRKDLTPDLSCDCEGLRIGLSTAAELAARYSVENEQLRAQLASVKQELAGKYREGIRFQKP